MAPRARALRAPARAAALTLALAFHGCGPAPSAPPSDVLIEGDGPVAIAATGRAGLLAAVDGRLVRTRPLDARGRPAGQARAMVLDASQGLVALEPVGDRWLLLSRDGSGIRAQALDARGRSTFASLHARVPGAPRTIRRASAGERVAIEWATAAGARGLEMFELGASSIAHTHRELGDEPAEGELPVEILGLALDGEDWAVVWRRGVAEHAQSEVRVTTRAGSTRVEALHEALVVESIALERGTLRLIAAFEFARPTFLSIPLSGVAAETEPESAAILDAGAPIPPPFTERARAELSASNEGLFVSHRDGAGFATGARARVVEGRVDGAAIARACVGYLVAWRAGRHVRVRAID